MDWADIVVKAAALLGAGVFVFYVGKWGVKPVLAKITGWFTVAKTDFTALEARVTGVEVAVGIKAAPSPTGPTGAPSGATGK